MSRIACSFPALPGAALVNLWPLLGPGNREAFAICSALASVIVLLFGWAFLLRRRRRGRHRYHYPRPSAPLSASAEGTPGAAASQRRRRRHRPRNPTLAETGGLPPARNQEPETPN